MGPIRLGLQYLLSVIFIVQMYVMMLVLAILYLPAMIWSPQGAIKAAHAYCRWVIASARLLLGLRVEVRGEVPTDTVLVAAKHQSFFDIIILFGSMPYPRFIMKRELIYTPILGQYALRMGCIPVNRAKGGQAIRKMLIEVRNSMKRGGQLLIYPQGTRLAPGAKGAYKIGTGAIYQVLKIDCVPVATNVGVFWPRHGVLRKPGVVVMEFLPRIAPGMPVADFMAKIEAEIEPASDRLMLEAGFDLAAAQAAFARRQP